MTPDEEQRAVEAAAERDAEDDDFLSHVAPVVEFALKLKARMRKLEKDRVRILCPSDRHAGAPLPIYITAALAGRRGHLRMACADPDCTYRLME